MSDNDKDNKDFDFIQEQIIEKKRKKIRKLLFPSLTTVGFAVLFGITAAVTFVVVEPRLNKLLHKEEETVTPVCFPTEAPNNNGSNDNATQTGTNQTKKPTPTPVIVKQSIAADANDFISMNNDIQKVAANVNNSIVNIVSTFPVEDSWFGKSVEKTVNTTGVIIYNNKQDLLILVSLDRVKDAKNIKLVLSDTYSAEAKLQGYESDLNLALIAVPLEDIPEIYINNLVPAILGESYSVSVGKPVIALGSPNGYAGSMELGIVTSKGSSVGITDNRLDLFNTNIEDNENSDGIIVNLNGEIIGLMTRTLKEDKNKTLSTVIGISELKPILEKMGNKQPLIYFGVKTDDMSEDIKDEYKIDNGIYVNSVQSGSPAFDSGIQKGDIILQIGEHSIVNSSDFNSYINEYQPGTKISIKILRANSSKDRKTLNVTLEAKKN